MVGRCGERGFSLARGLNLRRIDVEGGAALRSRRLAHADALPAHSTTLDKALTAQRRREREAYSQLIVAHINGPGHSHGDVDAVGLSTRCLSGKVR